MVGVFVWKDLFERFSSGAELYPEPTLEYGTVANTNYNTAFPMRNSQFKYQVIPLGLTNAPATFQLYSGDCVLPQIDNLVV